MKTCPKCFLELKEVVSEDGKYGCMECIKCGPTSYWFIGEVRVKRVKEVKQRNTGDALYMIEKERIDGD